MFTLFQRLWGGLRRIGAILMPFGKKVGSRISPIWTWLLHIVLLVLGLLLLYWLNGVLQVPELIVTRYPIFRHSWLPILGLLVYLLGWNIYWVLSAPAETTKRYPEIDDAWDEAVRALRQAKIDLTERPLYLVLGHPEAPEDHLFEAARLEWTVPKTPDRSDAWLHVYANRDTNPDNQAIYVTCSNVCLLGKLATRLALADMDEWPEEYAHEGAPAVEETIRPGLESRRILSTIRTPKGSEEGERASSALWKRQVRRSENLVIPDIRDDEQLMADFTARLAHLCERIAMDRSPFCGINGILVVLPLGASDTEREAAQTADLCKTDLATIREVIGVVCPVFVLMTDLETTWGFSEFLAQHRPEHRLQRIGQRFPLATDLEPHAVAQQIHESLEWMCTHRMRDWVNPLMKVESTIDDDPVRETENNVRLYRLLSLMTKRREHIAYILRTAMVPEASVGNQTSEPWLYGGCYLAATGKEKDTEQGFVLGVLNRLNENQMYVAWTAETLARDKQEHSQAMLGYAIVGVLWLVAVGIVVWRYWLS